MAQFQTAQIKKNHVFLTGSDLPHPDGPLLECFLQDSADRARAAGHVLERYGTGDEEASPGSFLSDWKDLIATYPVPQASGSKVAADVTKRDGGKCRITGLGSSILDPLVVTSIFPRIRPRFNQSHYKMLGAFLGPALRDWVMSDTESQTVYENLWLVRKSAALAFAQGYFLFTSAGGRDYVSTVAVGGPEIPPIVARSEIRRRVSPLDPSITNVDGPSNSALQIFACFAKAIRWTHVAREIAQRQPREDVASCSSLGHFILRSSTVLVALWLLVPDHIRMHTYRTLARLGGYLYGLGASSKVQQLPFGMYLKVTELDRHEGLVNEFGALQLVRQKTSVPVPRPLDLVSDSKESFLLTSRVVGHRLGACIDSLSDAELRAVKVDLLAAVTALRGIPKLVSPEYTITNAVGRACLDYRIMAGINLEEGDSGLVGPFRSEAEFNDVLRCGTLPDLTHRTDHAIVFTHVDLNMRNILVDGGRFSGLVDWENSGWYPECRDYTKARYTTRLEQRWLKMVDEIFEEFGPYGEELEIETQLWHYCF